MEGVWSCLTIALRSCRSERIPNISTRPSEDLINPTNISPEETREYILLYEMCYLVTAVTD